MNFESFLHNTGFAHLEIGNVAMILIGIIFIYLAVVKDYEPLLPVPEGWLFRAFAGVDFLDG